MKTTSLFTLKSKIHFSNGYKAYSNEGLPCDIDTAEYIDIMYDTCTEEYKHLFDDKYELISAK